MAGGSGRIKRGARERRKYYVLIEQKCCRGSKAVVSFSRRSRPSKGFHTDSTDQGGVLQQRKSEKTRREGNH